MMRLKALAVVFGLAACGKSSSTPKAESTTKVEGSPCKSAVAHVEDISPGRRDPNSTMKMKKDWAVVEQAMTEACEHDRWPAEVTDCMKTASDIVSEHACEKMLTLEQQQGIVAALNRIVEAAGPDEEDLKSERRRDQDYVDAMQDQRDRMCACNDAACAQAVDQEVQRVFLPRSDDLSTKFKDLNDARIKCFHKVTGK
jgi:hypothetical protein